MWCDVMVMATGGAPADSFIFSVSEVETKSSVLVKSDGRKLKKEESARRE